MARSGEGAKELKPIMSASDVFAKAVPRGQGALPYTHTINICFPHADQPIRGPAPAGMAAQVYDCTPVELQAAGASGSRTQQRLAEINNRSAIMNAINVACAAYRDNQEGVNTVFILKQHTSQGLNQQLLRLHWAQACAGVVLDGEH